MQVYWLELDYLDVAEAALHCSASMTALLYIEEWYKEQHKQLKLARSSSSLNMVFPSIQLLCIYRNEHTYLILFENI